MRRFSFEDRHFIYLVGSIRISPANSIAAALTHERKTLGKYRQLKTGLMIDLLTDRMRVPEGVET